MLSLEAGRKSIVADGYNAKPMTGTRSTDWAQAVSSPSSNSVHLRVLALGNPKAAAYESVADALITFGQILFRDEKSFRSVTDCIDFVREGAYDLVLMPNPYGNEHRLQIYQALKQNNVPIVTFDRGGLPRSWFFDVGFNADSPSYASHVWDHPLAPSERVHVRRYIEQVRTDLEPLEAQGARVGAEKLRKQLAIGDRKVLFVPFQRPSDTTVRYFSSPMRDFAEFESLVGAVEELTRSIHSDWVVIAKKHPLENVRPSSPSLFANDNAHINDLIELADAVLVLNSGAGLLSLCWDKPVLIAGTAYYANERLNMQVRTVNDVCVALRQLQSVDAETRDRFFHHLIRSVYSFGNFHTELVRQTNGSWRNVTRRIDFDCIRMPVIRRSASLLYVTSVVPWPINRGAAHRTHQMLTALCAQDLAIDILCLNQSEPDATNEEIAERLRQTYPTLRNITVMRHPKFVRSMRPADLCARLRYQCAHAADGAAGRSHTINCAAHCPPAFARKLKERLAEVPYAAVWFNYLRVLPRDLATDAKIICDLHDFQTERIRADVLPKLSVGRRNRFLQRYKSSEARALGRCDLAIAISPPEMMRILDELNVQSRIVCLPATDFARFPKAGHVHVEAQFDLLFVGSRSDANFAGITWFLRQCFPRIVAAHPRVRLRIHGAITEMPEVKLLIGQLDSANVITSGPSESMDEVYTSARVVICPIRHGTGMKIKMIEAMAFGKAIVTTSMAAEGIATDSGVELFDSPEDFANACLRLIESADRRLLAEKISIATFLRDHEHNGAVARLSKLLRELRIH